MAERQLILPGDIVKISNAAARAQWPSCSVWEKRLVAHVASLVRSDDVDFHEYEIPVKQILQDSDKGGKIHKVVDDVCKALMSRVIKIQRPDINGWEMYNVFSRCIYDGKNGTITARFDPGMRPHYLDLKCFFTEYGLIEFLLLPSTYSQQLFTLLKSWDDKPNVTFDLSYLHKQLDVPDSFKANFAAFRRRVLEQAQKDIHKSTKLRFTWEPIKKGKAVVQIRFEFAQKRRKPIEVKNEEAAKVAEKLPVFLRFPASAPAEVCAALNGPLGFICREGVWTHAGMKRSQANEVFKLVAPFRGEVRYTPFPPKG